MKYMMGFPPHIHKRSSLITKCQGCGFLGWTMLFVKVPNARFLYGKALFKVLLILALLFIFHVPIGLGIYGAYKGDCDKIKDADEAGDLGNCNKLNFSKLPV